jgi:predicted transposase YbfD/YdcC
MTGKACKALSPSLPKEKSISSLDANDPKRLERVVRAHWAIENNLYWVLDIAFDEDSN